MTSRIALITGGSRGLGRASALALAEDGTDVVLTYLHGREQADEVVAELAARGRRAVALQLDTRDDATFAAFAAELRRVLVETWGREQLDVLVHNAGTFAPTPFGATDPGTLDDLFALHVRGPMLLTDHLAPLVADGGHVLTVSSGLTRFFVDPVYAGYAAMKGAVEVWTRYLAVVLGARGIAVNTIAPGATATDFGGGAVRDTPAYQERIAATSAMGRVGQPDDIGRAVAAIVSGRMGWVTGQRIEASGGQAMGHA